MKRSPLFALLLAAIALLLASLALAAPFPGQHSSIVTVSTLPLLSRHHV